MNLIYGYDVSRYSTNNKALSAQDLSLVTGSNDIIIAGAWHGLEGYDSVCDTLSAARSIGKTTASYTALTPSLDGTTPVMEAYRRLGSEWPFLSFVSIDCELDGITLDKIVAARDRIISLNQRPVLYTGAWWWVSRFGNPPVPAGLPVWLAEYGPIRLDTMPPFAGAKVIGQQYHDTQQAPAGFGYDLNVFDGDFIATGPGTMAGLAALRKAWEDDMADTIAGAASLHNGPISYLRLALYAVRQQQKSEAWGALVGKDK